MSLNLNSFPYFDDYNKDKKFHRVLFKPGVAVQARELTQLQTMLQEQIKRFGDHVFKEGSVITGCAEESNFQFPYVTILDTLVDATAIDNDTLADYEGEYVIGQTTGVRALIKKTATGEEGLSPNLKTFYLQYVSSGDDFETTAFEAGEILELESDVDVQFTVSDVGFGSLFSLGDGIVYAGGNFILHSAQTIILERYSQTPTKEVGFVVVEDIVDSTEDETLLDPAQGSFNFTAPGGDRLKLSTELVAYGASDTKPDFFNKLFDIVDGSIQRRYDQTPYGELNRTLARRTYDESGDYTVRPFPIVIEEHPTDSNKVLAAIAPGKAYVRGYEHELLSTKRLDINKATETESRQNQLTSTFFGNYVLVENVSGVFTMNGEVTLRNSTPATIGTARIRDIQYDSGTGASSIYRLHLFNVQMTTGNPFGNVASIIQGDAIAETAELVPSLKQSSLNTLVFPLSVQHMESVDDFVYTYRAVFNNVVVQSDGTFSIALTGDDEWGFTTLGNYRRDIIVIAENDFDGPLAAVNEGDYVFDTLFPDGDGITIASTQQLDFDFDIGGLITPNTVTVIVNVSRGSVAANPKTLQTGRLVGLETDVVGTTGPFYLGTYGVLRVSNVWMGPETDAFTDYLTNNWQNVTTQFVLDDGQRDGFYGISSISPRSGSSLDLTNKKLLVQFDYLNHATTSGYYTVNSYGAPSQIGYEEIPLFRTASGATVNLRNCLDFRPTVARVAGFNDATVIANVEAGKNPSGGLFGAGTFQSGATIPDPNEEAIADLSFFIPRIDRLVLNSEGSFVVVEGNASLTPARPLEPDNSMTLGFINVAPFPSLSEAEAQAAGRPDYANSVVLNDNRRFTMRDIGQLSKRIERLEYYTALSLLELNTATLSIPNADGDDRFKNGILVDSFAGTNIVDRLNPGTNCSIGSGRLGPAFALDNVEMVLDGLTNAVRAPRDAIIVVRQTLAQEEYTLGSTVTASGSGATGLIKHIVPLDEIATHRWVRLYLNNVNGTFGANETVTGPLPGQSGTITFGSGASEISIDADERPALVVVPEPGALVTLPFTHDEYARNPFATKSRNCSNALQFVFEGVLTLDPPIDPWTAPEPPPPPPTPNAPTGNPTGNPDDAIYRRRGFWIDRYPYDEDWRYGNEYFSYEEYANREVEERGAVRPPNPPTSAPPEPVRPPTYMRSRVVNFYAVGMKPNTRVYPFFDGLDVSAYCRPAFLVNNAAVGYDALGASLVVNSVGVVRGQFVVPEDTFLAGSKVFTLTDDADNAVSLDAQCVATALYTAGVQYPYETAGVVSTLPPGITTSRQYSTQNIDIERQITNAVISGRINDPIAQTFFVSNNPGGMLVTKIDLYFRNKSLTQPIVLQIRETVNGTPSQSIVPYSTIVMYPEDINVSEDASSVTEFKFQSPVYLKNNTEYAFVLLPVGSTEDYQVWVSELGQTDIGSTEIIDRQPSSGVFFVSANGRTWTSFPNEDMKFTVYRAEFDPDVVGQIRLKNEPMDFVTITDGEDLVVGDLLRTDGGAGNGHGRLVEFNPETGEGKILVFSGYFEAGDALEDYTLNSVGNEVVGSKTATLDTIENKILNAFAPGFGYLDFNTTDVVWGHRIHSDVGIQPSGYTGFTPSGIVTMTSVKSVFSNSDTPSTLLIQGDLSTEVENLSPVIDLNTMSLVSIANDINNVATDEDTADAGQARSRYISKSVVLADGLEAEDLQVYVTALLAGSSSIRVYAKLRADTDSTDLNQMPWVPLTGQVNTRLGDYTEYRYTIPDANKDIDGVYTYGSGTYKGFKTFAIKIVLLSTNTSTVPTLKDMRAVALQA